jgi:hypothetical protein
MESTASAGQKGTRRNPNPSRPCWHSPEQTARLCPTDRVLPPAEALPGLPQGSHWWELSFRADLGESSELKTLGLHSAHCSGPMGKFLYASSTVRIRGCGSAEWHRGGSRWPVNLPSRGHPTYCTRAACQHQDPIKNTDLNLSWIQIQKYILFE